jgi:hypothetical protein
MTDIFYRLPVLSSEIYKFLIFQKDMCKDVYYMYIKNIFFLEPIQNILSIYYIFIIFIIMRNEIKLYTFEKEYGKKL